MPAAAAFPAYGIDPVVAVVEESSERSTIMAAPTAEDAPGCARLGLVVGEWVRAEEGEAARVRPGRNAQFARRGEGRVTGRVTRAFPGN